MSFLGTTCDMSYIWGESLLWGRPFTDEPNSDFQA